MILHIHAKNSWVADWVLPSGSAEYYPSKTKVLRMIKYVGNMLHCMSETQAINDGSGVARELTAFQQNILVILAEEPRYGLAIKRELESYYESEVNHGRLYPNLDTLVDLSLVEKSELDKRTNQYALTDAGYDAILDQFGWSLSRFVTNSDRADDVRALLEH